jgi:hypothetical protein
MAKDSIRDPVAYQTPVAQYLRGICSAVISQKENMKPILKDLIQRLEATEDGLFDDKLFRKSQTYHWIIKICYELYASVQTNLEFLGECESSHIHGLLGMAHI